MAKSIKALLTGRSLVARCLKWIAKRPVDPIPSIDHNFQITQAYRGWKFLAPKGIREELCDFAELAKKRSKKVDDFAQKWSWFEEFYKKCKPGAKDESPNRVYGGPELEAKFSEWVLNGQLPMAADVRKLYECLEDKNAIAVLDRGGSIDEAIAQVAASRPALNSKIWKQVEDLTGVLSGMPMSDIDDLRNGDAAKIALISNLLGAVKRVMTEGRLKF